MKIIIDNREHAFIKLIKASSDNYGFNFNIEISKLDIGDILIQDNCGNDILIIERKTVNDLAASIRDGRYKEQSYRLNGHSLHNHNIIYLIEGNISSYSNKYTKIKSKSLYSSLFSLNYFKGFSILRTNSINESVDTILFMVDKLSRENKDGYYSKTSNCNEIQYTEVVKKVKKDNITNENIGSILLSQIPGVSVKTACIIMEKYDTIFDMMKDLEQNNKCLDELTYETSNNIKKRISRTAILNILKFLIYKKSTIKIET